jgi:hypothetical protein
MSFIVAHFVRFASYAGLSSGIIVPETGGGSRRSDRISKVPLACVGTIGAQIARSYGVGFFISCDPAGERPLCE